MSGTWLVPAGALCALLLVAPGLLLLRRIAFADGATRLAAAVVLAGCLGIAAFWIFLASPATGLAMSFAVVGASLAWLVLQAVNGFPDLRDAGSPLLLYVATVCLYCSLLTTGPYPGELPVLANEIFFRQWGDNGFQNVLAQALFAGRDVAVINGWPLSERPPLQAGIFLATGIAMFDSSLAFEAMGVASQCTWVIALQFLAHQARVPSRWTAFAIVVCAFTGFFYLHGVFTWPKLLAAAMALIGTGFIVRAEWGTSPVRDWALGTAGWGCAWLAHGGTGFALLLAIVVFACAGLAAHRVSVRALAGFLLVTLAVSLASIAPWHLYKRHIGQTQEKLAKYHLAGQFQGHDSRSVRRVVRDAYARLPTAEIAERKRNNVLIMFGAFAPYEREPIGWRRADYYHLFHALGLLNLGMVGLGLAGWRARQDRLPPDERAALSAIKRALVAALLVLVFWVVAEFGATSAEIRDWVAQRFDPPLAATIMHQGSFIPFVLLFGALAAGLRWLPAPLTAAIIAAHVAAFAWFYVITPRDSIALQSPVWPSVLSALACAAWLGCLALHRPAAGRA